jgi:hypothetical protein
LLALRLRRPQVGELRSERQVAGVGPVILLLEQVIHAFLLDHGQEPRDPLPLLEQLDLDFMDPAGELVLRRRQRLLRRFNRGTQILHC